MADSIPVPEKAVTLAAVALHDDECPDRHCSGSALSLFYGRARVALSAGAEAIRADERERSRPGFQQAIDRVGRLAAACQDTAVANAVKAEQERIRQLALTQASAPLAVQSLVASHALREFAELIGDDHD